MTIRELEAKTGLERSNIRFYEREGLVVPVRLENGYRDYSEGDLQLLIKIKLLRRLDFSLDAIRALRDGEEKLDAALARRLEEIYAQKQELDARERVCRRMKQDGAEFGTLDAQRYLQEFSRPLGNEPILRPAVPATDRVEPTFCPFRRFFARALDTALIQLVPLSVLTLVFRCNLMGLAPVWDWALAAAACLLLIPVEAFLISRFGTTPGKWLMGIRLEHVDGRKLTYEEALDRAKQVFWKGQGAKLPIVTLWRNWRSYKNYVEYGLDWDYEVHIAAKPNHAAGAAGYFAVYAAVMVLMTAAVLEPARPIHRSSDLTLQQVVENYNYLSKFYSEPTRFLREDGTFSEPPANVIEVLSKQSQFEFTEQDGVVTAVSLTETCEAPMSVSFLGNDRAVFMAMAFAGADDGYFEVMSAVGDMENLLYASPGTTVNRFLGCLVVVTVETEEYEPGVRCANRRTVTMQKLG